MAQPPSTRQSPVILRGPLPAALIAGAGAIAYLVLAPRPVDLAAAVYRSEAFGRNGLAIWDGGWYAGQHTFSYSVLFPPLGWLLGPRVVGALSAVAAAVVFERLVARHFGARARFGAIWFAAATATLLMSSRLPFALGVAIGLAALWALPRRRALAAAAALACALASPVAALFLALAALAAVRVRGAALVAATGLIVTLALALAFPAGGYEPFTISGILPLLGFCALAWVVTPRRERALRAGYALYAAGGLAAYLVATPMGGNALRLGTLFGGPIVVCAAAVPRATGRRLALAAVLAAFLAWPLLPALGDLEQVAGDPAADSAFYRPLAKALERVDRGPPFRVEVPFTRAHWEAAEVARRFPLARGWDRQLDIGRNPLFYGAAPLNAATYRRWLDERAVRFVALPHAALDDAGAAEARLIERGLPYLRLSAVTGAWRIFEVAHPRPLATVPAPAFGSDWVALRFSRAGSARVAVWWSPYWSMPGGCVARDGDWVRASAPRAGVYRLRIAFSLARVVARGRRCG